MLDHEIGSDTCGGSGPTHDTVDHNQATAFDSFVNEGSGGVEVSEDSIVGIEDC